MNEEKVKKLEVILCCDNLCLWVCKKGLDINFGGFIIWDSSKPDSTPRKLLDISKINSLGWSEKVSLNDGLERVYLNYTK